MGTAPSRLASGATFALLPRKSRNCKLLDLFKEHFDLRPAAVYIGHAADAPTEIVGQKLDLALLAVDLDQANTRRGNLR